MENEQSLQRMFSDGFSIKAWRGVHEGTPHIMVQWRKANNQPAAQPFMVSIERAPAVFKELAAFAEDLACNHS